MFPNNAYKDTYNTNMSLDWKYILTYDILTISLVEQDEKKLKEDRKWEFKKIFNDTYSFEPLKYLVSNEVLNNLKADQILIKTEDDDIWRIYIKQ